MSDRSRTWILVGALLLGGAAALGWETLFQHLVHVRIGSGARAAAITVATMMLGMTTGALVGGRTISRRHIKRPLRTYAALEVSIGALAILTFPMFDVTAWFLSTLVGTSSLVIDVATSVLIALPLLPPTIAIGVTIPLLKRIIDDVKVPLSVLYGVNTLGAAMGTLLIAFVLFPSLGVFRSALVLCGINVVGAGFLLWLDRLTVSNVVVIDTPRDVDTATKAPSDAKKKKQRRASAERADELKPTPVVNHAVFVVATVAFLTGFATFVVEIAAFRGLVATLWSTTEAFALLLVSVLVSLAVAAPLSRKFVRDASLPRVLMSSGILIALTMGLVAHVEDLVSYPTGYAARMLSWTLVVILVMAPGIIAIGLPLPHLLDRAKQPDDVGRLLAFNTFGAVVGALGAAWILLPTIGFFRTGLLAAATIVVGAGALFSSERARPGFGLFALTTILVVGFLDGGAGRTRAIGRLAERTPHTLLAFTEGPDVTTAVIAREDDSRVLLIDGFAATEESAPAHYMAWMGHLPMILHDAPADALVICFGTGQTAHATRLENPRTLDLVDINKSVFEFAPYFRTNRGVLDDPRVRTIVMDGREFLRRESKQYDVVTLEPMPPTFAGVNALYSKEFYELVHRRLNEGGIVAQWVPFHILSPSDAKAVIATVHHVFPDSALFIDPASGTGIVVGRKGDRRDLGSALPGFSRPDLGRSLPKNIVERMMFLLPDGVAMYAAGSPLITDDNQRLAYGKDRIDRHPELIGQANKMNLRIVEEFARKTRGDIIPSFQ